MCVSIFFLECACIGSETADKARVSDYYFNIENRRITLQEFTRI